MISNGATLYSWRAGYLRASCAIAIQRALHPGGQFHYSWGYSTLGILLACCWLFVPASAGNMLIHWMLMLKMQDELVVKWTLLRHKIRIIIGLHEGRERAWLIPNQTRGYTYLMTVSNNQQQLSKILGRNLCLQSMRSATEQWSLSPRLYKCA